MRTPSSPAFALMLLWAALSAFTPPLTAEGQKPEHHHGSDEHKAEPATPDRWTRRANWQMPIRVMKEIGVRPGMSVADIGAGEGYFSFYLAQKVGPGGKVFASDIDGEALKTLRERAAREQVGSIATILGTENDPKLPEKSIDLALIVNVLPMIQHPKEFFGAIEKGLKPGGTLAIIQWAAEKYDREEPDWDLPERNAMRFYLRQIYDGGFEVVKLLGFLPMQNIYICKPRGWS